MDENLEKFIEDFSTFTVKSVITKNWNLLYKDEEYSGQITQRIGPWDYLQIDNFNIDDEKNLTDEEFNVIKEYVTDNF